MVLSMDRWFGKVAVVTGAASGIGAAIVDQLITNGLIVAGIDLNPEPINNRSKQLSDKKGQLHALKADVSKEEEMVDAFKWITENLGPVHILVNSAGFGRYGNFMDGNVETWTKVLKTNVLGLCIGTREAIKSMKANNINGHIVNINSNLGHRVQDVKLNVYPASKFAVTALTETVRQELNGLGAKIKVTSISPSIVDTNFSVGQNVTPEFQKKLDELPKLQAEDVADGVLYALSTPEHVQVHELMIQHVNYPS